MWTPENGLKVKDYEYIGEEVETGVGGLGGI